MMHATLLAAGISEEWGKVTLSFIRFCLPLPPRKLTSYNLKFLFFLWLNNYHLRIQLVPSFSREVNLVHLILDLQCRAMVGGPVDRVHRVLLPIRTHQSYQF